MINPFSLEGKRILVTGASSGIGKQTAIILSNLGAQVILSGRDKTRLEETLSLLQGAGHTAIAGDLTTEAGITEVKNNCGALHGLVNAAGIMKLQPFKFITAADLEEIMRVNFFAPINLTKELVTAKKISSGSSVIFITSINGAVVGSKANSMYAGSKGALTGMIKAMAIDLAKSNIRVNNIAPAMIETEGFLQIQETVSEESIAEDKLKYPLGRYGKPEDVAYGCAYLLSDASNWVTGITLVLDGGFTIQ